MDLLYAPASFSVILSFFLSAFYFLPRFLKTWKTSKNSSLQTPPGTTGLPVVGETLDFISAGKQGVPERFITERVKKYSSKVFKTSLLGEPTVVLAGPDGNKFLFSDGNKLVKSWWPRTVIRNIFVARETVSPHEESMKLRKMLSPYFRTDTVQKYLGIMDSAVKQHLRDHWDGKQFVEAHPLVQHFTFSFVCRLIGIQDKETIARLEKPFCQSSGSLLLSNIPGSYFHQIIKESKEFKKEIDSLVKHWKADLQKGRTLPSETLTEILRDESDDDVSTKILALFAASYGPTSGTLACIIMHLGQEPHVYDKVLTEQIEIAKSKGADESLKWGDLKKMTYSWNVACEVLRLNPPVPGTFREATANISFGGYLIPKGWKLHWNAYSTHRNPEYFKEPEKFDPSRFEGNGPLPYSYAPFGGGPLMCPGKEYARTHILAFMHYLVTSFRWEQAFPDEKVVYNPHLKPTHGLPIRLYPNQF